MRLKEAKELKIGDEVKLKRSPNRSVIITDIIQTKEKKLEFKCRDYTFSHKEILSLSGKNLQPALKKISLEQKADVKPEKSINRRI